MEQWRKAGQMHLIRQGILRQKAVNEIVAIAVVTPEEEAAVLDYLSESDEHLDDFLAMSAAVEVNKAGEHKRHIRPLWPSLSIAASVILFLCIEVKACEKCMQSKLVGSADDLVSIK